jgi:hypothetical protein
LISTYYHIKTHPEKWVDHPFFKKIVDDKWSLERFFFCEEMKNYISQYLWSFPLEKFSFIGISEYMESDFQIFCSQFLDCSYEIPKLNVNERSQKNQNISESLWQEVEKFHEKDMNLYTTALEMRNKRNSF